MKHIILLFYFFVIGYHAHAQGVEPKIDIRVNKLPIQLGQQSNINIHKGDTIYFKCSMPDKTPLETKGYTVRFYKMSKNFGKTQRQEMQFSKVYKLQSKVKGGKKQEVFVVVNELLKEHAFDKIDIQLDKIYKSSTNVEVQMHSSKRTYSFLLF